MGYTRKYLVRSAAMVALLWLGAAQAHSVLHRFDPGSGAATPPRVMTIAEEMVDLRRELTCLREVASRMDAGATALRGAPANSVCFTRPTLVA